MKVTPIPLTESTVKHSFALKKSTAELLLLYQASYQNLHGVSVSLKDLAEQMLLDFMADDKAFQKKLKKPAGPVRAAQDPLVGSAGQPAEPPLELGNSHSERADI